MSNKDNKNLAKILGGLLAIVIFVIIDQITKHLIEGSFELNEKKSVIEGFFSLHYVRNTGSAFSFLADKSWGIYLLSGISLVFGLLLLYIMIFALKRNYIKIGFFLGLISAGAFGNLIDRFVLHYVIDFLRFDFGSNTFPIFNVADCYAVIGTILLIIFILFSANEFDEFWNELFHKKAGEHSDT